MYPAVVSNLGEWSAFFEEILKVHKSKKNSAFHDKTVRWPINLINTATTKTRGGQQFLYFDAVDTGRAAIGSVSGLQYRRGFLIFADRAGLELSAEGTVYANKVAGTLGYNIRALSLAATYADFDGKIVATMNRWFEKARESVIEETGNKRTPKLRLAKPRTRTRQPKIKQSPILEKDVNAVNFNETSQEDLEALTRAFLASQGRDVLTGEEEGVEIVPEYEATAFQETQVVKKGRRTYNRVAKKLADRSRNEFDIREFERRGAAAAQKAAVAEQARQARLASASNAFKFLSPLRRAQVENNPVFQKFMKLPNWIALAGIFVGISGNQVEEVWKPNTPVRTTAKLVYLSGGKTQLLSPPGGRLRNSYKLVTDREIIRMIGS